MNKTLVSGWAVAAAIAAAWVANVATARKAENEKPAPAARRVVATASAKPRGGGRKAAPDKPADAGELPLEPWQRGVKVKSKTPEWKPMRSYDLENAKALRLFLDDASPEVQTLADRIVETLDRRDYKATLECATDAAACPNPVVRAMMAYALADALYNAGELTRNDMEKGFSDFAFLEERKRAFAPLAIEAARKFLSDSNGYVSDLAGEKMLDMAIDVGDVGKSISAVGEIFEQKRESARFWSSFSVFGRRVVEMGDEARSSLTLLMAREIEGLDGEVRKKAEKTYESLTGSAFGGVKGAEEALAWRNDIKAAGTELFGTEEKGESFANAVDDTTRNDPGRYDGLYDDVKDASQAFSTPNVALLYADTKERLRKTALERYGNTEEGVKWFAEELEQETRKLAAKDKATENERLKLEKEKKELEEEEKKIKEELEKLTRRRAKYDAAKKAAGDDDGNAKEAGK